MKKLSYAVLMGLFVTAPAMAAQQGGLPVAEKTNSINLADNTMMQGQDSMGGQQGDKHMSGQGMDQNESMGSGMQKHEAGGMRQDDMAGQQGGMNRQDGMMKHESGGMKQQAMEEQSGFSRGSVVRSAFTSSIEDREPVDKMDKVEGGDETVYFFTELRDMSGQTAKHRWEYNGKVMAEVEFNVNGPRWRVWSSKNLQPSWTGEWKVSVLNGANEVIAEKTLVVKPAMGNMDGMGNKDSEHPSMGSGMQTIESDTEMMPGN